MSKCIFFYDNLWADITKTITYSTQHPNFPAINSRHRDFTKPWKSRHGAGSGWGQFTIELNVNDAIDFDEGGGELQATLTPGIYNADTLCAEIKTQMDAAGALTYTISYSDTTNKFTIAGSGNFTLRWNTGTRKARSVADALGYIDSADDDGATNSFIADYIRIHTEEHLGINLEIPMDVYDVVIQKHNIQSAGMIQIWGSNAADFSTGIKLSFSIQDDILILSWSTPYQYQYWRFYIEDPSNPDGYVELGYCFLGPEFRSTRQFSPERSARPIDPSLIKRSEGGQVSTIQRTKYFEREYEFQSTNQKPEFEAMFESIGTSKGFFFCEDSDNPLTKTFYAQFIEWEWEHVAGDYWNLFMTLEKLR